MIFQDLHLGPKSALHHGSHYLIYFGLDSRLLISLDRLGQSQGYGFAIVRYLRLADDLIHIRQFGLHFPGQVGRNVHRAGEFQFDLRHDRCPSGNSGWQERWLVRQLYRR